MQLYGTVRSERASKGQGGNEFLEINLQFRTQSKQDITFAIIKVHKKESDVVPTINIDSLGVIIDRNGEIIGRCIDSSKGEKKKDGYCYCHETELSVPHALSDH